VANRPLIGEDLVVVAALKGLVAEEVDVLVRYAARPLGILLEVAEAVGLVPADGEDVKGDLASNGEARSRVSVNTCSTIATMEIRWQ
jgi:hypothetical protein